MEFALLADKAARQVMYWLAVGTYADNVLDCMGRCPLRETPGSQPRAGDWLCPGREAPFPGCPGGRPAASIPSQLGSELSRAGCAEVGRQTGCWLWAPCHLAAGPAAQHFQCPSLCLWRELWTRQSYGDDLHTPVEPGLKAGPRARTFYNCSSREGCVLPLSVACCCGSGPSAAWPGLLPGAAAWGCLGLSLAEVGPLPVRGLHTGKSLVFNSVLSSWSPHVPFRNRGHGRCGVLGQVQGRENPDLQGQGQEVGGLLGLLCCVDLNSAQGVRFNPCKVSGLPPELFLLV